MFTDGFLINGLSWYPSYDTLFIVGAGIITMLGVEFVFFDEPEPDPVPQQREERAVSPSINITINIDSMTVNNNTEKEKSDRGIEENLLSRV